MAKKRRSSTAVEAHDTNVSTQQVAEGLYELERRYDQLLNAQNKKIEALQQQNEELRARVDQLS